MDIITQNARFRQGVVKYSYKHTVAEAAIRYRVSERSIYRWRDRYDGTLDSLKDRSRRPKHCNNEQTAEEIALIKKLYPYYPDKMTLWDRLREKGYKRCYQTLCKTIRKLGLETSGGKRKPRKPKPFKRAEYPGQKVQIDVKHVPSACVADGNKYYQYTAIDECTRLCCREMYDEHSTYSSLDFIKKAVDFFPFPIREVQTDNGTEWTNALPVKTSTHKTLYVARKLENLKIQYAEEENALYVPEFALDRCKQFAAEFKSIFPGIKDNIKMDIDVLVLSSESLDQLLDKLQALGYEIKRGKYLAVKSPEAQKFTRLKSLGEDYLPENLEKRIANRNAFPNAVHEKTESTSGVEREFHLEILRAVTAVQGLAFRPKKAHADKIYDFENDDIINRLSKQILTLLQLKINSREELYTAAEDLEKRIAENLDRIKELQNEIPTLKKKIEGGNCTDDQRRRYELPPQYIDSLKQKSGR